MVDSLQEKVNILLEGGLVEVRIHAQEVNAGVKHQVMQAMMLEDMIKERERC
jgi:flagella basal body P-ring formation protein FlgA